MPKRVDISHVKWGRSAIAALATSIVITAASYGATASQTHAGVRAQQARNVNVASGFATIAF